MEMSYHLTGLYPSWWNGHRFTHAIKAWAIGVTTDSTRKVMQLELMGTISAKDEDSLGTGSIPRHLINLETLERDGDTIKVARIKHVSGEVSVLEFRSTQAGTSVLMGTSQDYIWIDEESPHNSLEIFSQCSTRTTTTGGLVLITATPENGMTSLIQMFYERNGLFIFHAGWDDCPHLSEETKKALLETYPEWEKDMR
jgi:phage terminase large subunit-like protein